MKTRTLFTAASVVILLLGLGFAWREWSALASCLAPPSGPTSALRSPPAVRTKSTLETSTLPAAAARAAASAGPQTMGSAGGPRLQPPKILTDAQALARGATDPAFTASYLRAYRAGVRQEYWDFLRQRGATEEQVQGVIEIMAKWKEAALDARAAASADQTAMAAAEIKASDARSLETRDAALRALLGPDAVGQLEGYDGTKRQRILVADIAAPAFAIGEPLSGAQSRELVRLISSSNLGIRREGAAYVGPTDSEYDALFSRASAFLTPNQVAVMREILVKQREDLARLTR